MRLHPANKVGMDFTLKNRDIDGAWADSHANIFMRKEVCLPF